MVKALDVQTVEVVESIEAKAKLPGEAYSPKVRARFWIVGDDTTDSGGCSEGYVGIGRIELLEHI